MTGQLLVVRPGLRTLLVDAGRPRTRGLGVPVGGAADRLSLAIGNALVGNHPETVALEITLSGPVLQADVPIACVVTGAPFEMQIGNRLVNPGTTFTLEVGQLLEIGGTSVGVRGYLCIRGGLEVPEILGSQSGLAPISPGATFSCHSGRIAGRSLGWSVAKIDDNVMTILHTLPGGQATWFSETLDGMIFQVGASSDRMGLRLHGRPLIVPGREMTSEPVCPGTVQVTKDGSCIVLGVDGQTIGGYPKIAQVISTDLDRLGQLRPGARVTFRSVTLEDAETMRRHHESKISRLVRALHVTLDTRLDIP